MVGTSVVMIFISGARIKHFMFLGMIGLLGFVGLVISAIRRGIAMASGDDVVLIAGKGHETYQIIGTEKHHLDEREVIAEHLAHGNHRQEQ